MGSDAPKPITPAERLARIRRIRRLARRFGYVGRIEYRHADSETGGAQFAIGSSRQRDLLIVYAEAFDRDADPSDFSLDAIIAHERGHQIIARSRTLQGFLIDKVAPATEEILASLLGSLLVILQSDKQALILKALDEVLQCGIALAEAIELVTELRGLLEEQL